MAVHFSAFLSLDLARDFLSFVDKKMPPFLRTECTRFLPLATFDTR